MGDNDFHKRIFYNIGTWMVNMSFPRQQSSFHKAGPDPDFLYTYVRMDVDVSHKIFDGNIHKQSD